MSAWHSVYKFGLKAPSNTLYAYAIEGIKNELAYNGFKGSMVLDTPTFGDAARNQAIAFQKSVGIAADGEIGPTTARFLFRKRAHAVEDKYGIPRDLLNRQKTLESNNDPAAIGQVDPNDTGLMQIHLPFFPGVTVEDAVNPAYSIDWGGKKLSSDYQSVGKDWDGALAAYNIGLFYAIQWVKKGKPTSGGPISSNGTDLFTTASNYVKYVKQMPV